MIPETLYIHTRRDYSYGSALDKEPFYAILEDIGYGGYEWCAARLILLKRGLFIQWGSGCSCNSIEEEDLIPVHDMSPVKEAVNSLRDYSTNGADTPTNRAEFQTAAFKWLKFLENNHDTFEIFSVLAAEWEPEDPEHRNWDGIPVPAAQLWKAAERLSA
jgi:hypothetical protein